MKTCYVMVGLPATGKSTFIKKIKTKNTWIYSTDMYIDSIAEDNGITYSEAFESNIKAATRFNDKKLESVIYLENDVIWDQTNTGIKKRKKIISKMKENGYKVECICILHPEPGHIDDLKEWKYRLNNRDGKIITQEIISNMMENFVLPTKDEGFNKVTYYNIHGAEIEVNI